jgi:hypothetical protein
MGPLCLLVRELAETEPNDMGMHMSSAVEPMSSKAINQPRRFFDSCTPAQGQFYYQFKKTMPKRGFCDYPGTGIPTYPIGN